MTTRRLNFTQEAVESLSCPADKPHIYFYDSKRARLCVCVTRTGHKSFYLYYKSNGRPERVRIGSFPPTTVAQARDAADRVNGEIAAGENPAEQRRQARGEQTLGELFNRYIEDHAKLHKRSWRKDQEQFDLYCGILKSHRLSDVHRRDIQQIHNELGAKHRYAANRLLALLSKLFNFATELGFSGHNPCKGIKRFREQSRERYIMPDEMPRFLSALKKHSDQDMADFFRVLLFTGARRSNVQAMRWVDVNFEARTWTIAAEHAKAGQIIRVYLSDEVMKVLQRRCRSRSDGVAFVFPSYGATGHLTEPKAAWAQILTRAKIDDLRVHDLRRSLGSWMVAGGASLPLIGKQLGHSSPKTTAIYARLNLDPVKKSVDSATAAMVARANESSKQRSRKGD